MWGKVVHGIHQRLHRIRDVAQKIEDVPNFGPDIWTMRKMDKNARQIQKDCLWIGEGLMAPDCPGHRRMNRAIRERIRRMHSFAREIEDVPNFGADLWTMREVDRKCRQIKEDSLWIEKRIFDVFDEY